MIVPNAFAQSLSDVPSENLAGAQQTRFEQESDQKEKFNPPTKVPLPDDGILNENDIKGADANIRFELTKIIVTGNQQISSDVISSITNKHLNKQVSLNDIREIAREVKNYYRSKGYVAAYVYVPPQTIANGVVEITVIEGQIGSIFVEGNKWFSSKVIKRAIDVTADNVLFYNQLRKGLNYINRKKDIKVKSVLKPGEREKTTDLYLQVEDDLPLHFGVDVNNLGTPNTGKTRWGLSGGYHNLFGQMDELNGRVQLGKGSVSVGSDYSYRIHETGTLLKLSYSHSDIDVGGPFEALGVEGRATTYGFDILQPFYSSDHVDLNFNTGFDWKSIENEILGRKVGRDELRILNLGINSEFRDKWGKTFFPNSLHFGFSSFLGANDKIDFNGSRVGTGGQFMIYRNSLIRYHRLPKGMTFMFRGQSQLTNDRLPSSEQLRLGGAFSVRGYAEGEFLADSGFYVTNELLIPSYFFPEDWKLPYAQKNLREQIQGTVFFDVGHGRNRKSLVGESQHRTLAGAGLGVRVHLFDRVFARLQWATPTGSDQRNGSDTAFYYGISAEIL
jgi:hemolysin activation/secretion protein